MMLLIAAPESPRWLLAAGREMEALRALQYLRGMNARVELEVRALQQALTGERVSVNLAFVPRSLVNELQLPPFAQSCQRSAFIKLLK